MFVYQREAYRLITPTSFARTHSSSCSLLHNSLTNSFVFKTKLDKNETAYKWGFDKATHVQTCSRTKHKATEIKITNTNCALLTSETRLVLCFTQGVSKRALQWYSKCYRAESVTKTFTLRGVQTPWTVDSFYSFKRKRFRNTRHTVTFWIPV
jgi:hypothetical protein